MHVDVFELGECEYLGGVCVSVVSLNDVCLSLWVCLDTMCKCLKLLVPGLGERRWGVCVHCGLVGWWLYCCAQHH